MTFKDIFKSSFLENFNAISMLDMVLAILLSFAVGCFIFYIYKKTYPGIMYSQSFGVTLISLTMITTIVILAVTSNVVLSLGMVGALSIVRFRTAIKDPLDIVFLFWAIAVGIVLAAGLIPLAVIGSIVIGVILVVFVNVKVFDTPYITVITCEDETAEREVTSYLSTNVRKSVVKSKTVAPGRIELNFEVRLGKGGDTSFVNGLTAIKGVTNAILVSYNGDYTA